MENKNDPWKKPMPDELIRVAKNKGTEVPGTGKYLKEHADGTYHCAVCNNPIFDSGAKFDSGTGWPSFYQPISKDAVKYHQEDDGRTEVTCGNCGAHLGHVFDDAFDQPTGKRYCINSVCLDLEKKEAGK